MSTSTQSRVRTLSLFGFSLLLSGIVSTAPLSASAQECSHCEAWYQSSWMWWWGSNYWQISTFWLTQNNGQVTGSVVHGEPSCYYNEWPVAGSFDSEDGDLTLTASNPAWGQELDFCAESMTFVGHVDRGGCDEADGTWQRGLVAGYFEWLKVNCTLPTGESTTQNGAGTLWPQRTVTRFVGEPTGGEGPDHTGRWVSEWAYAPVVDECDIEGDEIGPQSNIPDGTGEFVGVAGTGRYDDLVGWLETGVEYYRNAGRAPCSAILQQQMRIQCAYGHPAYTVHELNLRIFPDQVQNTRDGVTVAIHR